MNEAARSRLSEIDALIKELREVAADWCHCAQCEGNRKAADALEQVKALREALAETFDEVNEWCDIALADRKPLLPVGVGSLIAIRDRLDALASSSDSEGSEPVTPRPPSE